MIVAAAFIVVALISGFSQKDDEKKPTTTQAPVVTQEAQTTQATNETKETENPTSTEGTTQPDAEKHLEVHFIDVGQADAELIICDGEAMLIDGGNADDSNLMYSYLKNEGIDHLKYVICTHPHEDHIGGLPGALRFAKTDEAYSLVTSYSSNLFSKFKNALDKQGVELQTLIAGDKLSLGAADITVLGPVRDTDDPKYSIVLRLVYGDTSFLFTGDAEADEEHDILLSGEEIASDVLKVGHHGSSSSTTRDFLDEVNPDIAVISCEINNPYGHPHKETLAALNKRGINVYRTDESGSIILISDGKNIYISTEK